MKRILRKQKLEYRFSIAEGAAILEDLAVTTLSINEPRYRYQEVAPEHLTVPVSELLEKLPPEFRREAEAQDRSIDLPCRDLLAGNTPRLSLGQLNELLPDLVVIPEGTDGSQRLELPAGWVAKHYRLVTKREEISQERASVETSESAQPPVAAVIEAEVVSVPAASINAAPLTTSLKTEEKKDRQEIASSPTIIEAELSKEEHPSQAVPKRGLFASLPMFRRHQPEPAGRHKDHLTPLVPPGPSAPSELSAPVEQKSANPTPDLPVEEAPSGRQAEAVASTALTLESLWKLDPEDQLADPSSLQALFMTEEKLTLDRVIEMAGQLPGLRACVLAHGENVVCASQTPTGLDLQTLSGQAMTMLAQIRESSSNMGLGAVPAITLHAEQGALSFLHNGELCLLVLHADRGFVPGVRERLQEMLGLLSDARPALAGRAEGGNLRPET